MRRDLLAVLLVCTVTVALTGGLAGCGDDVVVVGHRAPKIRSKTIKKGFGASAKEGQMVGVHYVGKLPDGKVFMDTHSKGSPHIWRIGDGTVIVGMDMAVRGMKPGEIRIVKIPPELHWGRNGYGGVVPPNTTLTFEIELISVN